MLEETRSALVSDIRWPDVWCYDTRAEIERARLGQRKSQQTYLLRAWALSM
jgi:hypothetical protein